MLIQWTVLSFILKTLEKLILRWSIRGHFDDKVANLQEKKLYIYENKVGLLQHKVINLRESRKFTRIKL